MPGFGKLIGVNFGRQEEAVNFEELSQDEPEMAIIGEVGKEALSEMFYQIDEFEEELDRGFAA